MSIRLILLIMGLMISNTINAQDNILILGDSLSAGYGLKANQGWAFLLQQRLKQQYPQYSVFNESISGDTTANGYHRLPAALKSSHPKVAIIQLGANDGLRGHSLSYAKKNLDEIIQATQQYTDKILILGMRIPPNYGTKYTRAFAALFPQLTKKYDLELVPFMLEGVAGHAEYIQLDGLHPNAQAQSIILDNIWPYLKVLL